MSLLSLILLTVLACAHGKIENILHQTDLQCDMSKTSLNRYWTKGNVLKPDGCINRTNISIIHMDQGKSLSSYYNILRDGARRVCIDYDIHCPEPIMDAVTIASVLPQIATDVAGSTRHGYADISGVSLPPVTFTGLNDLHSQGIITTTFSTSQMYNSSYNPIGSSLHMTTDQYLTGYLPCKKMIDDFDVTNILVIMPTAKSNHVLRRQACLDAMIDHGFPNNSLSWMLINRVDIEDDISVVSEHLLNLTNVNGIFATSIKAHDPAFYLLDRALNGNGSLTTYGLTKIRAKLIKCLSQVDFSTTTIDGLRLNITKFATSQQPYIFSSITMLNLAIYASTGNSILFDKTLLSGPYLIESLEDALELQCTADTVRYCHDQDPMNPYNNCSCLDTQNENKAMYLFHYGGSTSSTSSTSSDMYTYFKILENGATVAAKDHNITLNIIVSDNIDTFENTITTAINGMNTDASNNITNGIISPLPNLAINNLFRDNYLTSKKNILIGIANGYEYYKSLNIEQGNFFGSDDVLSGYKMSSLLHKNYSAGNLASIVCVDNKNGLYSSINDRCCGVKNYCNATNLQYKMINVINSDEFSELESPIGIISPGYSTCVETQEFINNENAINSTNIYIAGCFDASSKNALNGLVNENIKIIIDNQPWLIGYLSVLSLFNRLFLARMIVSKLVETGPKLITVFDYNQIQIKQCENAHYGFDFCPEQPEPKSQIHFNYPMVSNFSGIFILLLFVFSIMVSTCVIAAMYKYRQNNVIKSSQPLLLFCTIIGGIIMMLSGLIFFNNTQLLNNTACNLPLSIWCIGFDIFFISYTLRVWKYVKAIEDGLRLKRGTITTKGILIRLFVFISIDIILVTFASVFTPIQSNVHHELLNRDHNLQDMITSECKFNENKSYLWYIVYMYKLLLLIWVLMVAFRKQASNNKIKKLQFIALNEGPNITVGIYIVIVSFLLYIIVSYSTTSNGNIFNESIKWVLISSLSFICFITVLACVVMHKLIYIFKQEKLQQITKKIEKIEQSGSSGLDSHVKAATDINYNTNTMGNEELYFDPYLQRCEFLVEEVLELIKSAPFTSKAAAAILPKITNVQRETRSKKSLSYGGSSVLSTSKSGSSHSTSNHIELTTQITSEKHETKQNDNDDEIQNNTNNTIIIS